jgi:glycosyltransferase involved in cell wall biosynthesis
MIKVIHIITRLDMGGSAQNTLDTCLHLNPRKYDVYLIHGLSLESGMTEKERLTVQTRVAKARRCGVKIIPLDTLVRKVDIVKDLKTFFLLRRIIRRENPVIVHTHTSKAGILGRLAAWIAGVPIIIQTPHGHVFYGHFGPLGSKFFLTLEKLAARMTDRLVALTEQEKLDYIKFAVAPAQKLLTIHSGVAIDSYLNTKAIGNRKKNNLRLSEDSAVIGFVGWLLPIKGPMILLKAMGRIWQNRSDVELVFVGKGELEEELKKEVLRMGACGKVKFLGWRNDIREIMPIFDVFVLPSLNEGMGRVLVEAMAAGRPIVASRTGGIPDLVKHEENGLLVPRGDEIALAAAISKLLQYPEKAGIMGQRGKASCKRYSVESMVEKIDALYTDLINNGNVSEFL